MVARYEADLLDLGLLRREDSCRSQDVWLDADAEEPADRDDVIVSDV